MPTPAELLSTLEVRAGLAEQPNDPAATFRLQLALAWALPILRAHVLGSAADHVPPLEEHTAGEAARPPTGDGSGHHEPSLDDFSHAEGRLPGLESFFSKLLGIDVAAMNEGHGIGCPCKKCEARRRDERTKPFPRGSVGEFLREAVEEKEGRKVIDEIKRRG